MQLFIMRHGNAEQVGKSDPYRELTPQGQLEANTMAHWLDNENIIFDKVLVSPFKRAQQTAEKISSLLNLDPVCQTIDFITPEGNPQQVHDYIDGLIDGNSGNKCDDKCGDKSLQNLLIVSHMPLVSYLVAQLTKENKAPIFQTAMIAQIDYDEVAMQGTLVRTIAPNDL